MNHIRFHTAVAIMLAAQPAAAQPAAAQPAAHDHRPATQAAAQPADLGAFLAENDAAMEKMMRDMMIPSSGDVDRDFVEMMIPHHQGAIDMAVAVLRYGRNPQLRRLAQEIIVTQQQEITAMRLAVGDPLPPSTAAPTQPTHSP